MNNILFKILMLKGDAGEPTDEQTLAGVTEYMQAHPEAAIDETIINSAVDDWLDDHPEATTTVLDDSLTTNKYKNGSITEPKLSTELQLKTIKDYVTPEMFGAVGDGVTDDTASIKMALKHCIDNEKKLLLISKYYITSPLLTDSDYDSSIDNPVVINIEGVKPLRTVKYALDGFGGILFENGINVFENVTLRGSIYRVSFMPVSRTQTGSIFYNCTLSTLIFDSCSVSNILAFCHNTNVRGTSQIKNNRFLTVYYFAKCDDPNSSRSISDSVISGNYINGGAEMNNNHCFEWAYFNGTTIINNFIDYYQTIYYPYNPANAFSWQFGISIANQYQVFRYLYYFPSNISTASFSSVSDCFNWNNPTGDTKLSSYAKEQYTGHDNQLHDVPPFILMAEQFLHVSIKDAIIQSNIGNLVFIRKALTGIKTAKAELTINTLFENNSFDYDNVVTHADSLWNNGTYKGNQINIPFIKPLNALPSNGFNWSDYYLGEKINVNNRIYKFVALYNSGTSSYDATWADVTAYL